MSCHCPLTPIRNAFNLSNVARARARLVAASDSAIASDLPESRHPVERAEAVRAASPARQLLRLGPSPPRGIALLAKDCHGNSPGWAGAIGARISLDESPIVPDLALNGWSKVSIVGTWASRAVPM